MNGEEYRVDYEPGESTTGLFGGNSNWRGPIWFPINYLLIEALERYHHFYGDGLQVECPTGSGQLMNLKAGGRRAERDDWRAFFCPTHAAAVRATATTVAMPTTRTGGIWSSSTSTSTATPAAASAQAIKPAGPRSPFGVWRSWRGGVDGLDDDRPRVVWRTIWQRGHTATHPPERHPDGGRPEIRATAEWRILRSPIKRDNLRLDRRRRGPGMTPTTIRPAAECGIPETGGAARVYGRTHGSTGRGVPASDWRRAGAARARRERGHGVRAQSRRPDVCEAEHGPAE